MATNKIFVTAALSPYFSSTQSTVRGGFLASENPIRPDKINDNFANYVDLSCTWVPFDSGASGMFASAAGTDRPTLAWHARQRWTIDESSYFGYVCATQGGIYGNYRFDFNQSKLTPDYEPVYGHDVAVWPIPISLGNQFRNSQSLPEGGAACKVSTTGSNYTRSMYRFSCYYVLHIVSTGSIGSGNASFILEERPTFRQASNGIDDSQLAAIMNSNATVSKRFPSQFYSDGMDAVQLKEWFICLARIHDSALPIEGEGLDYIRVSTSLASLPSSYSTTALELVPLTTGTNYDHRIREQAIFPINEEYYGVVHGSRLAILSVKTCVVPLRFFNLATSWTSAVFPRIAGVKAIGLDIYVLSESGELLKLDGGNVTTLAKAPTLENSNRRYSSLAQVGNKLYALSGTFSPASDYYYANNDAQIVSVTPYDIAANTWGTPSTFGAWKARINGKSLHEMIAFNDKLYILAEDIAATDTEVPVYTAGTLANSANQASSTFAIKFDITKLTLPISSLTNIKIKMQFNTAAAVTSVSLKRVPKGSPANTVYTNSTVITFGGVAVAIPFVANVERVSDSINIVIDDSCDYYIVWHSASTNFQFKYFSDPKFSTWQKAGDNTAWLASPDATWTAPPSPANGAYGLTGIVSSIPNINSANSRTKFNWQLLVLDTTTGTWGAQKLTHRHLNFDKTKLSPFWILSTNNDNYTPSEALARHVTGGLCVAANRVIANSGFISQGLVTFDGANLVSIGYGGDVNVFGLTSETIVSFQVSVKGDAVMSPTYITSQDTVMSGIYYINNDFAWMGACAYYPRTESHEKNRVFIRQGNYVDGRAQFTRHHLIPIFDGAIAHSMRCTSTSSNVYGYVNIFAVSAQRAFYQALYLPVYYKWNGTQFVRALTFEEAAASPKTITLNDNIPLVDGLQVQFGLNASSSYKQGEYYTLNVCYGHAKFNRRMTYSWAMFPGQTFQNTETKALSDVLAINRKLTVFTAGQRTISGPTGVTVGADFFQYPKIKTPGVLNDADFVLEYAVAAGSEFNFSDLCFQINFEGARGLSFFVDKGAGYEQIYPLGRMNLGVAWFFNRQENVKKIKVVFKQATNMEDDINCAVSNFYVIDYGTQAQIDKARLGSAAAANGTPARGSFDIDCLGVAPETATILIDGAFNLMLTYAKLNADSTIACLSLNTATVPASQYLVHPFWGFVFFAGSSLSATPTPGAMAGTNMTISYHWGRRV